MKYTVIIEKAPNNYSAFSPDVLGCISVGDTLEEMRLMIREALEFHLEGMLLDGHPIPEPTARIETLEAAGQEYVVVYEKGLKNYAAYVPDFAHECDEVTGDSFEEVERISSRPLPTICRQRNVGRGCDCRNPHRGPRRWKYPTPARCPPNPPPAPRRPGTPARRAGWCRAPGTPRFPLPPGEG